MRERLPTVSGKSRLLPNSPIVWLGQSADTSSLCAGHAELRGLPFLTSLGCAIRRPSLGQTHFNENLRRALGLSGPLMLDSGGFALSRKPDKKWTTRKVGGFIQKIDADIFVTLDFPPRLRDSKAERSAKILASLKTFKTLHKRFPEKTIMPVVHGRDLSEIERALAILCRYTQDIPWVGLGGIVPLLQQRRASGLKTSPEIFIARALSLLRAAFPASKIHAFGAGGTRTFPAVFALGADSADSIGWRQAAGFGSIFLPMKSQRVVRWNGEKRPPRKLLDASDLLEIEKCVCPICRDRDLDRRLEAFRSHFYNRSIHNAWTVVHQSRSWPRSRGALLRIISKGALGQNWAEAVNSNSG